MQTYINDVKTFIIDNFLFGDGDSLEENTSFMENGIIDSTGILELITFLEEKYSITIEDDELVPDNLDSIQNVARFMLKKTKDNSASQV